MEKIPETHETVVLIDPDVIHVDDVKIGGGVRKAALALGFGGALAVFCFLLFP